MLSILLWGDSPTVTTGMGKVNKEILGALASTGLYDITCIGIHYMGKLYNHTTYPYRIHAANLDGRDLLGRQTFLDALTSQKWDLVITHQDLANINSMTKYILEVKEKQNFKWLVYSPIDNDQLCEEDLLCMKVADQAATYSYFGRDVITNIDKALGDRVKVMWLGTDTDIFVPLDLETRVNLRKETFLLPNEDTFLVTSTNANRTRKDLARTILTFKLFLQVHPNSYLYLHANKQDQGGDLGVIAKRTGLDNRHLLVNQELNQIHGFEESQMSIIIGCADVLISTSLAEGWGLSCTDAFACGTPVLAPRHTSLLELVGTREERGYFIPLQETKVFDWSMGNVWFPICDEKLAASKLEYIATHKAEAKAKAEVARNWVLNHTWKLSGSLWNTLVKEVLK